MNYATYLERMTRGGYGCAHCGRSLAIGDLFLDCADCAAIFCAECVTNGTFENHSCDDYEFDD